MNCLYYVLLHCSRDLFRQSVDIWYCQSYNCVILLGCLVLLPGLIFFQRPFCSFWELPSHVFLLFVCLGLWWWLCWSRFLKVFLWFLFSVWRGDEIRSGDIGLCELVFCRSRMILLHYLLHLLWFPRKQCCCPLASL